MRAKLIYQENGLRTFTVLIQPGEEVLEEILRFAQKKDLSESRFSGAGALQAVTLACPAQAGAEFRSVGLDGERWEVLFLSGEVLVEGSGLEVRIRTVLGDGGGNAFGGYLSAARALYPFEIMLAESPKYLQGRRIPSHSVTAPAFSREVHNELQSKEF